MNINIDLTDLHSVINDKFYPYLTNKDRYLVLYGGAGSGKSFFVVQKILIRILVDMERGIVHRFLCVRKTKPAIRKSVFALFQDYISLWNLEPLCNVNKSDMTITFINGSQIICVGCDDPEKLKSVEGITGIWCEEATELTLKDADQLDLRLRALTKSYLQIVYSFNPISKLNWTYNEFFIKEKDNATIVHSTYKDNRFTHKDYPKLLEGYEALQRTIYTLGEWGSLEHSIYSNYKIIEKFPDDVEEIIYGCDFGYNNPTALVKIGVKDQEYYLEELLYRSKMTNADLIVQLKLSGIKEPIYCDSAEPQRIEELRRAGIFAKPAFKGKNSVKDGIDFCKRTKFYLTEDSINLIKEMGGYCYKKDKDDNILEEPVKFMDHALDAFRYGIYTHFKHSVDYRIYTGD